MGFLDKDNELVGFDIDLAKEAFKRAGYKAKFENTDWSMKEQSLKNGSVDCLWNGYSVTDERKEKRQRGRARAASPAGGTRDTGAQKQSGIYRRLEW